MICPSPISIPRPSGLGNYDRITVPCQKCHVCLTNLRNDWTIRLIEESKNNLITKFITLTYEANKENLSKRDVQLFIKKLRHKYKFRYFLVGEYGSNTHRPHYHMLLFTSDNVNVDVITRTWDHGFIQVADVNDARIHYITKYHVLKNNDSKKEVKSFCLISKKPPIGYSYIKKFNKFHKQSVENRTYYQRYEYKMKLPRFYKNKIYNHLEHEKIKEIQQDRIDKLFEKRFNRQGRMTFKLIQEENELNQIKFKFKNSKNETI